MFFFVFFWWLQIFFFYRDEEVFIEKVFSQGSCVRASVTEARATVYPCFSFFAYNLNLVLGLVAQANFGSFSLFCAPRMNIWTVFLHFPQFFPRPQPLRNEIDRYVSEWLEMRENCGEWILFEVTSFHSIFKHLWPDRFSFNLIFYEERVQ